MEKQRMRSFDALKFLGILLVVWGHSLAWFSSAEGNEMISSRIIYSFHMPLFMAIAGFFSAKIIDKPLKDVLWGRCLPLLVPTCTLGVVLALYNWYVYDVPFLVMLTMSFWFLVSLAMCTFLYYITLRRKRGRTIMFFVGLLISQILTPLLKYNFQIGTMYPAFLMGALLSMNFEWFKRHSRTIFLVSTILYVALMIVGVPDGYATKFDLHHGTKPLLEFAYQYLYKIITGISGAIAAISLFEWLAACFPVSNLGEHFCAVGRDTLAIYVLSGTIVYNFVARHITLDTTGSLVFQFVLTPIIAIVTIEICVLLAAQIRKVPILAFLIFGEKKKKKDTAKTDV